MQGTATGNQAWIRRYHPAPESRIRLVALPHAGGSATYFHPLSAALSPEVETLAVQYPGRQDRRHEAPVQDIGGLADHVTEALRPYVDRPLALFGHSMGSTIAFEVARRLERDGTPPVALIASGRRAPRTDRREGIHRLDDAAILAEVRLLGGTDETMLQDEELVALTLTALRNDYKAVETYRCDPGAVLSCPVTVLVGDNDPRVSIEEARAWGAHTTAEFGLHVFSGGHFYLAEHQRAVTERLRAVLEPHMR
ncbi:thioesterase II family protein [Streptomyces sp. H10-C2]|uniref:thioesterase II family protein n=1 Tax=unclassified Streptomyces TaxID=2593676 RepID=UPI0024B93346|nr:MULTISPECIES: thioesterase II family protein [unclassified Streptomyces]MDJ0346723.1 thioesterase II family protein [Streptomyces sp. PH10-H1]MDJ0375159.1 thioesterase II family protein [Streptomyces sp. H10-C2]